MNCKCHMGCDPPEHGGDERFYMFADSGVIIYGHTIDAWGRNRFPEDIPGIEYQRSAGNEFGCWHSQACPDGEFGFNPTDRLVEIPYRAFIAARDLEWPIEL